MSSPLATIAGFFAKLLPVRNFTERAADRDFWYEPISRGGTAGQHVSIETALTFSGCWAATNAIAGLFGALPCKTYRKTADGREEVTEHPVHRILYRQPNDDMDSFVFWEMMTHWWINYGNAFAEIQRRESSGRIEALWPIHPSRVQPELDAKKHWTHRWIVRAEGGDHFLDDEEVFNIVGPISENGLTGRGVIHYARKAIGTALAEQQYQGDFFANGGRPSGVLEHPGKLTPAARDDLRQSWRTIHGRGNEIAVLWENMKYNPIASTPETAEINESRVLSVQEISRFYDLTPHALYELSHGTFANTEEMNRYLVTNCLFRRIVRTEKACDRQLFSDAEKAADYYTKFNVSALLRGNPTEQANIAEKYFSMGVLNQDEVRAQLELNRLPNGQGQEYFVKREFIPASLALESAKRFIDNPDLVMLPSPSAQG